MSVTEFITENFVNLLLILTIFYVGVSSKKENNGKRPWLIAMVVLSLILTVFLYSTYSDLAQSNQTVFLVGGLVCSFLRPICILFFFFITFDTTLKQRLLLSIPVFLSCVFFALLAVYAFILQRFDFSYNLFYDTFYILPSVCLLYFLIFLLLGIRKIVKKERHGILIVFTTAMCILALVFQLVLRELSGFNATCLLGCVTNYAYYYLNKTKAETIQQEAQIQNQRTALTISQIQPHFLYNVLGTIGYLCKKDPAVASKAIDEFSDYLRANLNSISQRENVPFTTELKHIQTYLWLEQLRFEEKLQVYYDINVRDFILPPLSVQPIVENAVKHGICEKPEGGTLWIRTFEYATEIKIIVEDNGVGFNINEQTETSRSHVGIENVRARLKSMCDGTIQIKSEKEKGTVVTITIPRR